MYDGNVWAGTLTDARTAATRPRCWQFTGCLKIARSHLAGAIDLRGQIYAIGGIDGSGTTLSTVEVYHPTRRLWELSEAHLQTPRSSCAAVAAGKGIIYAIGGMDSAGYPL